MGQISIADTEYRESESRYASFRGCAGDRVIACDLPYDQLRALLQPVPGQPLAAHEPHNCSRVEFTSFTKGRLEAHHVLLRQLQCIHKLPNRSAPQIKRAPHPLELDPDGPAAPDRVLVELDGMGGLPAT